MTEITSRLIEEKLSKIRALLVFDLPFFATIALRMEFVDATDTGILPFPTMGTDGKRIYYHRQFIADCNDQELLFVMCHECMHIVLAHPVRLGKRDPAIWNMAGDYAINPILSDFGLQITQHGLLDGRYSNMDSETIYEDLIQKKENGQLKMGHGDGGEDGHGDGKCGCGGIVVPTDEQGNPLTGSEISSEIAKANSILVQAAQVAKSWGNVPGSLKRLVDNLLKPEVKWQELFRLFMEHTCYNDYSWIPPSSRHMARGFCLPSVHNKEMGEIVIAIDTSGSIGQHDLNQFAAEFNDILSTVRPNAIHVVYCDTRVQHVEEFDPFDYPVTLDAKGGGGTDFRPPFTWVDEQGITPKCLLYFTDLYCNSFPKEPDYPTMWIVKDRQDKPTAPFGDTIHFGNG